MRITIEAGMQALFPELRLGCYLATVSVQPSGPELMAAVNRVCEELQKYYTPDRIRTQPVVEMTRQAYRRMGQDPSRYRPSAESLLRRIATGKGLYRINNLVDILNLISVQSGFSIGGYDADTIQGDVHFGIGRAGEPYEGIGRGALNIENLPVFRDAHGAFGTSTSDSVRTMVTDTTHRLLMIFPVFTKTDHEPEAVLRLAAQEMATYAKVSDYDLFIVP